MSVTYSFDHSWLPATFPEFRDSPKVSAHPNRETGSAMYLPKCDQRWGSKSAKVEYRGIPLCHGLINGHRNLGLGASVASLCHPYLSYIDHVFANNVVYYISLSALSSVTMPWWEIKFSLPGQLSLSKIAFGCLCTVYCNFGCHICILRECLGWSLWHKYSTLPRILAARSLAGLIYWSDSWPKDISVPKLIQRTFKAYFFGPCNFYRINQRPQCQKGFDSLMIGWSVKLKLSTMGRRHGSDQQGQERGTQ